VNNAFVNVGEVRGRDIAILDVAFLREAGEDIPDAHLLVMSLTILIDSNLLRETQLYSILV
jgi:hypothetical protein